ncbi:myosin light chain 2 [Monosporozyma unispora]
MEHSQSITFNQLNQEYISRLKDAFQMFDDDGDGIINKEDLVKSLVSVGKIVDENDPILNKMLSDKDSITFAQFLNVMSEKSGEFDEELLEKSLSQICNDDNNNNSDAGSGKNKKYEINEAELMKLMQENGVEDIHEFDKIFQTFVKKGVFSGKQFLDTVSEK